MLKRFFRDETGLELSEYAVAAALVILVAAGAFSALGGSIDAVVVWGEPIPVDAGSDRKRLTAQAEAAVRAGRLRAGESA